MHLAYPGKRPAKDILTYLPKGQISPFIDQTSLEKGVLIWGDNFPVLALLQEGLLGAVDLIYIDPPFGTGRTFTNLQQQKAYEDGLVEHEFLEFLRVRLILLKRLLSDRGSIYLHIDKKIGHYVKLIMDEIWGKENFLNDITRIKCNPKNFFRKAYGNSTDMILLYAQNKGLHIWNDIRQPLTEEEIKKGFTKLDPVRGPYTTHPLHAPGKTHQGDTGQLWKGLLPPEGRHWRYSREKLSELDNQGLIEWSPTGNPRKRFYASDHPGSRLQDIWYFKDKGQSYVKYPTEKNTELLHRIILQSSEPQSIVMDAFAGSGNTLIQAHLLNRRWLGIECATTAQKVIIDNLHDYNIPYQTFSYKDSP